MSGSFDARGALDVGDGRILFCTGKKRSGKSIIAKVFFLSFPWDKLVVDVARDDGPSGGEVIDLQGDASTEFVWPEHRRKEGKPMTLRYVPDPGSPTFLQDVDAVLAMVREHGLKQRHAGKPGACVLIHEIGVIAPVHKTQPHMRRVLMHNRHDAVTAIFCGPRPMNVDPLVLQQADVVYAFELPNKADRQRLAEQINWDVDDLSAAFAELGPHEYLRYDSNEPKPEPGDEDVRLLHFPRLPDEVVEAVK